MEQIRNALNINSWKIGETNSAIATTTTLSLLIPAVNALQARDEDSGWVCPVLCIASVIVLAGAIVKLLPNNLLTRESSLNKSTKIEEIHIDKHVIFENLHNNIVLIDGGDQKGSAVVVNTDRLGTLLITVEHVANSGGAAYLGEQAVSLDDLERHEIGPNIVYKLDDQFKHHFKNSPLILVDAKLEIGEKVYFGGYPFQKSNVHLHQGHVSSIGEDGEFSIDGVAVSGMSGGPIAIKRNGKLYVVGTIASETFDPIKGFSKAVDEMYSAQDQKEIRDKFYADLRASELKDIKRNSQLTKIRKDSLYIGRLKHLNSNDPSFFNNIWEDLNKQGVISNDGEVNARKIIPGKLGLRPGFQQYEYEIIARLEACTRIGSMDSSEINLPFEDKMPTDSVNTVGLSLVQSLSTGLITGNLFLGFDAAFVDSVDSEPRSANLNQISKRESTESEIGRSKRAKKIEKKQKNKAIEIRNEAIKSGSFQNSGVPPILYRYVSAEDAKIIRQKGIVHLGTDEDEIPFLTQPNKGLARSVGAVTPQKLVTVYTDKINPPLCEKNVKTVSERNGVKTYRINTSIPREAIEISEA